MANLNKWDRYWHLYKLTEQDYEDLKEAQSSACAVCQEPLEDKAVVDHCHRTGKVRGLLCQQCNSGLGFFKDSILSLLRAIKYLIKGK